MRVFFYPGKEAQDEQTLSALGVDTNDTIELEVISSDPINYPIKGVKKKPGPEMPDVITVRVVTGATFQRKLRNGHNHGMGMCIF